MKAFSSAIAAVFLMSVFGAAILARAATDTQADIEAQIQARTEQLQQVNQELQATQSQLSVVQNQKNTLQNQVKSLDTSIKQLNLNIRSDQLVTANLSDEIGILQGNLEEIGAAVDRRKQAIASTLQELQQGEGVPLLVMLFTGRSLAEGFSDAHSLGERKLWPSVRPASHRVISVFSTKQATAFEAEPRCRNSRSTSENGLSSRRP